MAYHSLLPLVAIVAVALLASRAASYPWTLCGIDNFTANSKYQANLNLVAATLPNNASTSPSNVFATAVAGAAPDRVWAAGLCRGDLSASNCFDCLAQAFHDLPNDCSYSKDAVIYYDTCILRYSSARVLSAADTDMSGDKYIYTSGGNVTSEPGQFIRRVAALLNATGDYAALNSSRRFATGEAGFDPEIPMVYALAQCTPDQTPAQCRKCLAGRIAVNLGDCGNFVECRLFWTSCNFRYETVPFFNGQAMVQLDLPSKSSGVPGPAHAPTGQSMAGMPPAGGGRSDRKKVLIIALVPSLSVLLSVLLACVLLFTRLRRRQGNKRPRVAHNSKSSKTEEALKLWRIEESGSEFTLYDFTELAAATGNFSLQNRLGRGGFGPVYKGQLGDGTEIAVKRLSAQSLQGLVEFKNEIQLIAQLQHTNLVRLVGCCVQEEEKMLVYEYMPNGSLDFLIFDPVRGRLLDWKKRLHIIEGIVLGLVYLHKHSRVRIIHRDLKASNILLDKDLNPKISDFGMARIFGRNITKANTNRVVGTYGYMAPEYASEGIFSVRSDVFSFGVLLLEIVSGKRNNSSNQNYGDFINLLGYAWQMWSEGRAVELIDPIMLQGNFDGMESITRCIKVALLCVQKEAMDRPTMTEVTTMLGSEGLALMDPKQPPHFHWRVSDDNDAAGGEDGWEAENRPQVSGSFSTNYVTVTMMEQGR